MADVVRIHDESLLDFIRREGGTVNTDQVAMRFGWNMAKARDELGKLAAAGSVEKVGRRGVAWGAVNDWTLTKGQAHD